MSKIGRAVKKSHTDEKKVVNFMGGISYTLNPIDTLKMIAASSIFGEPQYYRTTGLKDEKFRLSSMSLERFLFGDDFFNKSTSEIFEEAIDAALDYDFKQTIDLARELRTDYYMRMNPQVIMVRAAIHPKRGEFTKKNPGYFREVEMSVMARGDEPATQLAYYLYTNGSKSAIPSILKRAIADKLGSLNRYTVNKYKNAEIGMINAVRLTHAHSHIISELMKTGTVEVPDTQKTWEQMISGGMEWRDLIDEMYAGKLPVMPHMALLRNLRNIFTKALTSESDVIETKFFLQKLLDGVPGSKQFPFRYKSAYDVINNDYDINPKIRSMILETLIECMEKSIENLPKLKGTTMCLTDNSGSAWGAFTSEYGKVVIANINNLSSVIAAKCSDDGYVGKFGDKLIEYHVSKHDSIISQTNRLDENQQNDVGGATEGGIWVFFRDAIKKEIHYDNIFIFSDCQAGTGGLYGTREHMAEYKQQGYLYDSMHVDVYKLIQEYRKRVNPKVNVFCVQTAGYNNVLIPMMAYRCSMLTGWTGKEILYAAKYIEIWDEIDARNEKKSESKSEDKTTSSTQNKQDFKDTTKQGMVSYNKKDIGSFKKNNKFK